MTINEHIAYIVSDYEVDVNYVIHVHYIVIVLSIELYDTSQTILLV